MAGQAAQARGANLFLAYASAPPYWMTRNGCTNGGDNGTSNLKGWWGIRRLRVLRRVQRHHELQRRNRRIGHGDVHGTRIEFYGMTSSDSGIGGVSIDGGPETPVDFFSITRRGNALFYASPTLAPGTHTLTVRVTGLKSASSSAPYISIDRVAIYPDAISVDDQERGTGINQFNYRWIHYGDFAEYLTGVVNHFRDYWGITFTHLDPLNEPSVAWTKSGNQEGNVFDPAGQNEIILRSGASLAANAPTGPSIAAPDDWSPGLTNTNFNSYSTSAKDYVSAITTHTYGTSSADATALGNTAAVHGKVLWLSEFGTGGDLNSGPHSRPACDQPGAADLGDLYGLRPSAWVLWDGIESWEVNEQQKVSWGTIWATYLNGNETWTIANSTTGTRISPASFGPAIGSSHPGTLKPWLHTTHQPGSWSSSPITTRLLIGR